tara:strand:+ start:11087 stop:11692 length:606 start_codon:yes stop_codon:yes gene_type:complete
MTDSKESFVYLAHKDHPIEMRGDAGERVKVSGFVEMTDKEIIEWGLNRVASLWREHLAEEHGVVVPEEIRRDRVHWREYREALDQNCQNENQPIPERPEAYAPLTFDEALDICMNGGCVWAMDYSDDGDCPDYPVECPDECADIEGDNLGERVTWLEDARHPDTVEWDRTHWRELNSLEAAWVRLQRGIAVIAPTEGEWEL